MSATIIDGKAFAGTVREKVAGHVSRLKEEHGITPGLAVVLVGEDPASHDRRQVGHAGKGLPGCGVGREVEARDLPRIDIDAQEPGGAHAFGLDAIAVGRRIARCAPRRPEHNQGDDAPGGEGRDDGGAIQQEGRV